MQTKGDHQKLYEHFQTLDSAVLAKALIFAVEDIGGIPNPGNEQAIDESLQRIFSITNKGLKNGTN